MGQDSKIQWCDHTFNPWSGCTKVSDGCKNCYAAVNYSVKMRGVKWGPQGNRIIKADSGWKDPIKWNRDAEKAGERHRVFCASLADVFEANDTMPADAVAGVRSARLQLFELIRTTPHLDWLLLTKRPENVRNVIDETLILSQGGDPADANYFRDRDGSFPENDLAFWLNDWSGDEPPANVWLGASCENQKAADERIPHLLKCPAAVRFLSCEPLLGPIDLANINLGIGENIDKVDGRPQQFSFSAFCPLSPISWVIVGGESGHGARPCDIEWIRSLVKQCKDAGVAAFVKQLGANIQWDGVQGGYLDGPSNCWPQGTKREQAGQAFRVMLQDSKGGNPDEWPEDLRVRQFPKSPAVARTPGESP